MNPLGYVAAHERTYRLRGPASAHVCPCGAPAKEWAYNHEDPDPGELTSPFGQRYSIDPDRYVAMCTRCHRLFDRKHITHCPANHAYEGDNLLVEDGKRKCRACVYERNRARSRRGLSPEARRRKTELQRQRRAEQRAAREAEAIGLAFAAQFTTQTAADDIRAAA